MAKRDCTVERQPERTGRAAARLAVYYGALTAVLMLGCTLARPVDGAAATEPLAMFGLVRASRVAALAASWRTAAAAALAMAASLALMLPVAWIHSICRAGRKADESMVQTLLVLPMAVCAIAMLVQHSVPLAFSLAGIVAAVRFRNTLKDAGDAVFVFLAIGVGLASGVGALAMAVVMSIFFSAIMLAFTRRRRSARVRTGWHGGVAAQVATPLPAARPCPGGSVPGMAAAEVEVVEGTRERVAALLLVEAARNKPAWRGVEAALEKHAHTWKLLHLASDDADCRFEYRLRLRRKSSPVALLDEVRRRSGADVVAAEVRLLA